MKPVMRIRRFAALALIAMVFSLAEEAVASECVHDRSELAHVSDGTQATHEQSPMAAEGAAGSEDRSSNCRHNIVPGCGSTANMLPPERLAMADVYEITIVAPPPSSAVDLIVSHAAFHPPRN
jgi:hypothetical protein